MPGMTGLELHESLVASGSDIPTVLDHSLCRRDHPPARAQGGGRLLPSEARSARGAVRVRPLGPGGPARTKRVATNEAHGDDHDNELFDNGAASQSPVRPVRDRRSRGAPQRRRPAGAPRAQAVRPSLRPGARAAHAHHQERAARRRVGPPVRQRVGAEDDHQRPARRAAGRPQAAALHRDGVAPRLSVHRHGERGREARRSGGSLAAPRTAERARVGAPRRPRSAVRTCSRGSRPHGLPRPQAGARSCGSRARRASARPPSSNASCARSASATARMGIASSSTVPASRTCRSWRRSPTLSRRDPSLVDLIRAVAPTWLFQLPWLSSPEEREALRRELSGAGQARMLREMGELLDRYTEQRPLLLVTEDLHWSDPATVQLIDYLARRRSRGAAAVARKLPRDRAHRGGAPARDGAPRAAPARPGRRAPARRLHRGGGRRVRRGARAVARRRAGARASLARPHRRPAAVRRRRDRRPRRTAGAGRRSARAARRHGDPGDALGRDRALRRGTDAGRSARCSRQRACAACSSGCPPWRASSTSMR